MEVTYRGEVLNLDRPAYEAAAERPGKPLKLRLQPTFYRADANHRAWAGVSWVLDCRTAEEAIGVRKALEAFFKAVVQHGAGAVEKALTPQPTVR